MIVRWWINYYGRFYRSELNTSLNRINDYWCGGSCKVDESTGAEDKGRGTPSAKPRRPTRDSSPTGRSSGRDRYRLDDGSRVTAGSARTQT